MSDTMTNVYEIVLVESYNKAKRPSFFVFKDNDGAYVLSAEDSVVLIFNLNDVTGAIRWVLDTPSPPIDGLIAGGELFERGFLTDKSIKDVVECIVNNLFENTPKPSTQGLWADQAPVKSEDIIKSMREAHDAIHAGKLGAVFRTPADWFNRNTS